MNQQTVQAGPLILAAVFVQGAPALAYFASRQRSPAAGTVALGGLITLLATSIGTELGRRTGTNYVVGYITIPLTAGAYLFALSCWQTTYVERLTIRLGIALFIGVYLFLVQVFESLAHLGQYSHTLYSLVLLSAALWTLGRKAFTQEDVLALDTDWFWIGFGLAIYGAATAASAAIGNILLARNRVDLFVKAWDVRAALVILAFLAITWGVYRGPTREAEFAPHQ